MPLAGNGHEEHSNQSEMPEPSSGRQQQLDPLACLLGGNTVLVAKAVRGPEPD